MSLRTVSTPVEDMRERLIIGLDVSTVEEARAIVERVGDAGAFYKIGYQLAYAGGLEFARELIGQGKKVFLDLKLHDIANTVEQGVRSVARLGATFLTVHAYPQTMRAAMQGKAESSLNILAVTVLTSYDDSDLEEAGYAPVPAAELVVRRAKQARDIGIDGIVCAAPEAQRVRAILGPDRFIVTPGIRPAGAEAGDQKRVVTPADAIRAGATHLVVARPIIKAADPRAAAQAILDEMSQARQA
ncbi:orotidine-5'-phosphate decarboxylase [Microvirga rosea]|uniref:orotidine-5'-phosphate decarboxylase n=1 Tax=Microvirga rosea TaxID=2715425 RepID=UPI001D0A4C37|nr:orotidine-5'-phosphate decarboxylase [Microvirga rosea]MCB8821860.1 orotidine-5'-phosphate decarboxylase [Microvirga rosea]